MTTRTYSELSELPTFEERYRYLRLNGVVGDSTFGHERYVNQKFYRSREWKMLRHEAIVRDEGCDLGIPGREIYGKILVHHMNPVKMEDFRFGNEAILDLEYLICVTHDTHNAIHYGDESLLVQPLVERTPHDTTPWKRGVGYGGEYPRHNQEVAWAR